MNVNHDRFLRRFVWFIGLAFCVAGFAIPASGMSSLLISIMLLLEFVAVYSLEKRFVGVMGHVGFIMSAVGALLALNWKIYLPFANLNTYQGILFVWVLIAVFSIGCVVLGISTIRTGFVPTEIGYLLLTNPVIVLLPGSIKIFAVPVVFLAVGFFLMLFVSQRGDYDNKIATQQSVHRTAGTRRVFWSRF